MGDHTETIGVVLDVRPPLDPTRPLLTNPFGCLPNGRILATTVTLAAGSQANVRAEFGSAAGKVEFSCTDQAGAAGKFYKLFAAVDVHADDLASCGPSNLQSLACFNALADDDMNPTDNRDDRSAPRVQPPPSN